MNNIEKARAWIEMAKQDLKDAGLAFEHSRYPAAVFHSQQAAEKSCKAILLLFGIEAGKTHFPSYEIKTKVLRGGFEFSRAQLKALERVVSLSAILESQREFPRYGWETKDRIVPPSEIYDEPRARALWENAQRL